VGDNGAVTPDHPDAPEPGGPASSPDASPDVSPDTEPTQPIAAAAAAPQQQPPSGPSGAPPAPHGQPAGGPPAFGPGMAPRPGPHPGPRPGPHPGPPYPYAYAAPPGYGAASRPGLPGWVWPLLVVAALVTGLVGGLLGGALVLGTRSGEGGFLPQVGGAEPLGADNQSIAAVAAKVLPSTVQVRASGGSGEGAGAATGSGFVIDREGHIITNNHVVEGAADAGEITVIDNTGRSREAEIVGRSPVYDIAVLKVEQTRGLQPAALGSSQQMRVGQTVVAIGSPLGLSSTVTSGIVSALDRPVTTGPADASSFINAVQTDAAINPGNSGGPLVNLRGQVVGVNSAIATTGGLLGGERGNIGVGFAIPMEQVQITAAQILESGRAEYPVIGANVNTGDSTNGATVVEVPADTPAARAGLQEGDRIVAVDGKRVVDGISLIVAIRSHRPGETVEFTVVRGGEEQTVRIRLDAKVG
jgi:putative serine protease PepD